MRKCDEVGGPAGAVADDDGHGRRVRHVLQDGADRVGPALDHQAEIDDMDGSTLMLRGFVKGEWPSWVLTCCVRES